MQAASMPQANPLARDGFRQSKTATSFTLPIALHPPIQLILNYQGRREHGEP